MKQNNSFIWWVLPLVFILMLISAVKLAHAKLEEKEKTSATKLSVNVVSHEIPLDELEIHIAYPQRQVHIYNKEPVKKPSLSHCGVQ